MMDLLLQWRDHLVGALRKLKAGGLVEQAIPQASKINGSVEDGLDDSPITKVFLHVCFPFYYISSVGTYKIDALAKVHIGPLT